MTNSDPKQKSKGTGKHIVHELIDVAPLSSNPNASKLHSTAPDGKDDGKASSFDVHDIDSDKQALRGLTCLYTNADSLLNKRAELKATISSILPDVIAITEVYPKVKVDVDKAELEIDGFDCFVTGPEGRGACIYVKKCLNAKLVEHLTNSDFKESIWCEIRPRVMM